MLSAVAGAFGVAVGVDVVGIVVGVVGAAGVGGVRVGGVVVLQESRMTQNLVFHPSTAQGRHSSVCRQIPPKQNSGGTGATNVEMYGSAKRLFE